MGAPEASTEYYGGADKRGSLALIGFRQLLHKIVKKHDSMNTSRNNTSPQRTTSPFRLLILGGGAVVTECHLPALNALGWLRSCTVVEQIAANAEKVHRRFPGLSVANESYDTFLSHHAVQTLFDAAVISLPNTLHAEATRRCLEAGLHVLCEKPLALTASECESLGSVARRTGRLLVVGMVRR